MKTFIADIIPSIQRYSQRLDDLTRLTNEHWVSLGEINDTKKVYIFRANGQLLVSTNGKVDKGSWEYLGNQSLLLDTQEGSFLLKQGFFDENVIALKLDSTNAYAFFINETKYDGELNNLNDILDFLTRKYINGSPVSRGLNNQKNGPLGETTYGYQITNEFDDYDIAWGDHRTFHIQFNDGKTGYIFKGKNSGKHFYHNLVDGKQYCTSKEDAIAQLYDYLTREKRFV